MVGTIFNWGVHRWQGNDFHYSLALGNDEDTFYVGY
jgi:hypothetical protein